MGGLKVIILVVVVTGFAKRYAGGNGAKDRQVLSEFFLTTAHTPTKVSKLQLNTENAAGASTGRLPRPAPEHAGGLS